MNHPGINVLKPIIDVVIAESVQSYPGVQASLNRLSELFFMIVLREFILDSNEARGFASAFNDPRILQTLEAIYNQPEKGWDG